MGQMGDEKANGANGQRTAKRGTPETIREKDLSHYSIPVMHEILHLGQP
jgi:hypothetical protein